jgi:hypothetical protein
LRNLAFYSCVQYMVFQQSCYLSLKSDHGASISLLCTFHRLCNINITNYILKYHWLYLPINEPATHIVFLVMQNWQ